MADYSPEMRQFVCLLHLYHIKAYDHLRKILPLPHPYSLTKQVCFYSFIQIVFRMYTSTHVEIGVTDLS